MTVSIYGKETVAGGICVTFKDLPCINQPARIAIKTNDRIRLLIILFPSLPVKRRVCVLLGEKRETVKRDEVRDDRHIIREQTKPVE